MAKNNGLQKAHDSLPMKSEPRCNICNAASREKVDKLLAAQFSYTSIAEELVQHDPNFKGKELDTVRKNVERHSKRHVDIKSKAIRKIVEARAKEQGILLDSVEGRITSGRALLDLLIAKATDQATDPDYKVKFGDAIDAVRMLEDVQKAEFQSQLEVLQRQVWAISTAVKNQVPPSQLPKLIEEAERLFEMRTLEQESMA